MSKRQEDFDKAANEYAEKMCAEYHGDDADKRISKYEFLNGAEYGYQYAVEKAVEFLKEKEFGDWIEQEASSFIEDFRKAMK